MARQSEASKRNMEIVRKAAEELLAERPEVRGSPVLASLVVDRLRRSNPSAITYMERHCGGSNREVSAILDLTVRAGQRRGY